MIGLLGLTAAEVEGRRAEGLGNDEVLSTSRPLRLIIRTNVVTRFNAILGGLLVVIVVVGPFQDGLFGLVLVLNTVIGVAQEVRAKRTLDRLALLAAPKVRVRRDGEVAGVMAGDLVVGDVVILDRGDQIPLDGVLVEGMVEVDESLLSGESDPIAATPGREVMSGSFVVAGSGSYRVERVGADSYAHHLAGEARRFTLASSELRDGVDRFLQLVQWALVPVGLLLITRQLLRSSGLPDAIRGFVAGVSAMIPEGLILLTSVAFAIAAVRLARRRVLVQELSAVEGLARVDVLCVDKTGTLTLGGIEVEGVEHVGDVGTDVGAEGGADVGAVLGALAAVEASPNPTLAAIGAAYPAPSGWDADWSSPFSSARRWSAADFGTRGVWVLGAPDRLAPGALDARVEELARQGRRVVLLGRTDRRPEPEPVRVSPVALVCLTERVKPDAAEILALFRAQGVAVKVLSGDHPTTVGAIAREVGIDDEAVDASTHSDDELAVLVHERAVFGRVAPKQKQAMVGALKARGHTVAMTGDGVNDVLALKDADIGVAMGSGSAVTRGVAQIVLLDDSFGALVPVIAEGRRVIGNVERVANLFITKTVYATIIALAVGITGSAYPFLPRHITIIGNLTIGTPAFILALRPNTDPFRPGFVDRVLRFTVPCGVIIAGAALTAYFLADIAARPLLERRTVATLAVAACSLMVLLVLARPMDAIKVVLITAMAGGLALVVGVGALRSYFALALPAGGQAVEVAGIVAVACVLIETAVGRSRRGR